jgi:class 3 adenylate cyclase
VIPASPEKRTEDPGTARPEQIATRQRGLPFLRYEDESGTQRVFSLEGDRAVTIGRGDDAHVRLWWDPSVSLLHAEALPLGSHWLIADDGVSRNGTFVNGARLAGRRRLRDGDTIRVGRTTLAFHDARALPRGATTIADAPSGAGTTTLLFTDLVGSTELLDRLGDDAGEHVRREYFAILRAAAGEHGGREVKSLGDGLMVAFASALGAVACAVRMQQRIAAHGGAPEEATRLRIGLNAGEMINTEDDYFGAPVVIAKRLCDRAGAGQILASEVVRSLVGKRGEHSFRAVGAMQLKGLSEPVTAFELDWRARKPAGSSSRAASS